MFTQVPRETDSNPVGEAEVYMLGETVAVQPRVPVKEGLNRGVPLLREVKGTKPVT